MESGRTIKQDRMFANHIIEDIPDIFALFFHHLLGTLDGADVTLLFELAVDEGFEQFERHLLRQTALMQPKLGTNDDYRTSGVVDSLAKQILPKAAGFTLEHIGQGLKRALSGAGNGPATPAVIEQ